MSMYFDYNATSPLRPGVLEAMEPVLTKEFGNPSSLHQTGQRVRAMVEKARNQVATLIGAESPSEIIFTSGGTEALNLAIQGVWNAQPKPDARMIGSAIEHSAVRQSLKFMQDRWGIENVTAPVNSSGQVQLTDIEEAISSNTILVSVMLANNETGVLQPIEGIARICRERGVPLLVDAVQAAGKIPLNAATLGADFLAISGHKFGAPKGTGALYVRKGTRLESLIRGGSQERNRRGGTENVPAIIGMGAAADLARAHRSDESPRVTALRDQFESELKTSVPQIFINGEAAPRLGNTANIGFEYTDSSEMIMALDLHGISCSSGSACASGSQDPSHVLLAMGLPQDKAHASLRFSFGWDTQESDIQSALKIIPEVVRQVRKTNPLWTDPQAA